ncbi:MAG: NAD(P)/FAD-dependent oxidoreductase [Acidobacteriota bacterium]|nr:NAD(P)/FAD-dependent oxidoreductase [Acidobacteriota bacterium]
MREGAEDRVTGTSSEISPASYGPRVVIAGGGFAGLAAARALARAAVDVTLLDRRNYHLFQPLLYQVATGGLSPADISAPLRAVLRRQHNVRVLLATVVDIDPQKRQVILEDGRMPYDVLVLATGVGHHYFAHPEWERRAPGLKTIEDATEIRGRILRAFENAERAADGTERQALLTFVVIGAGPTGVELAGAVGELARFTLRRDFRAVDPRAARIVLIEGADRVLPSYRSELSEAARSSLARLGVEVSTDTRVEAIDERRVTLRTPAGVSEIEAATVLWAAGVKGSRLGAVLARRTGAELDGHGRVKVANDCSLPGHEEIFVVGDLAYFATADDEGLPGIAPVAMQQGRFVGKLIRDRLAGRRTRGFRYRNRGSLAVIGRAAAVADLGALRFTGYAAWILWLFIHIMYLVGFANRVLVLIQWAHGYLTRGRGARLITGRPAGMGEGADD